MNDLNELVSLISSG